LTPPSSTSELFDDCNHTELYQLCRRLGINVSPATPKEQLRAYLLGEQEPPESTTHSIDVWRNAIMEFLSDHWQVVRAQITCPAKNLKDELEPGEKRACFNCIDVQVLSCVVQNPENEYAIQLRRKA
jgi:hypothetical protein